MRTLVCLIIFLSLLVGASSAGGQAQQPRDVAGLIEAAQAALFSRVRHDFSGGVVIGDFQFVQDWAFGMATVRAPEGKDDSPWIYLFIGQYGERGWQVRYETEDAFLDWALVAPDGLIPGSGRDSLIESARARRNPERGDGSALLSLPYPTGETQTLTGGPHGTNWSSLDFAGGSGQIRAAREGTVWRGSSCPNFIRVDHPDGWHTSYYHMWESQIFVSNGQYIGRGHHIGNHGSASGCGGYSTGPHLHFTLRRNWNFHPMHNQDIGGWTVRNGSQEYQGCMIRVRDGYWRCVGQGVLNEGAIGSGFPLAPANTQLLINGDFSAGMTGWWTWGGIANPHVNNGVFSWGRLPGHQHWAVVVQTIDYSVPPNGQLELTFQLGNPHAVWKHFTAAIRDAYTWTGYIRCDFWLPPNTPLSTYAARGNAGNASFHRLQIEIAANSDDGLHALLDNVALYYRPSQNALVPDCIEPNNGLGRGLLAQFYNGTNLSALVVARIEDQINAVWHEGSPHPAVDPQSFSARYTGWVQARHTADYRFHAYADDGVRLWINNQLVVDRWTTQPGWVESPPIPMIAGRLYPIRLEYFEGGGSAAVALQWQSLHDARVTVPRSRLFPNTDMITNGSFSSGGYGWGTYATPSNGMVTEINNGALRFYRRTGSTSAAIVQDTGIALPGGNAVEATFQLGNESSLRKRITVILHEADWSDMFVCSFWLAPNAPMRTYRVRGTPRKDWARAHIAFYASSADNAGWYRLDNITLYHAPALNSAQTRCIDPAAPPAGSGANSANLVRNGSFSNGMNSWSTFATPTSAAIVSRINGGVFEFYRSGGDSALLLQNTGASIPAGVSIEAQFQLGNSSSVTKRLTVILHDGAWGDLAVCSFWLAPNTPLSNHVMRTFTTRNWTNTHIAFYASSPDSAGWYRIDNVSLIRRPALAPSGTDCYMPGSGVAEMEMVSEEPIVLPTLVPTAAAPYAPEGAPTEIPLLIQPALEQQTETSGAEGTVTE